MLLALEGVPSVAGMSRKQLMFVLQVRHLVAAWENSYHRCRCAFIRRYFLYKQNNQQESMADTKGTVKTASKKFMLFSAALRQNVLKSDVARFSATNQNCLTTNQFVASCQKLLKKVESCSNCCNKICTCCSFYRPKANLFCNKWRHSSVWLDSIPRNLG